MTRAVLLLALSLAALGCERDAAEPAARATAPAAKEAPAKEAPDTRPVVLFIGDSLTAGFGLPADASMPARVQERIDAADLDYRVVNAGRSGDTTAGGVARLEWHLGSHPRVAAVVIGLGSNDAMRGLPLDEAEKNLAAMVATAREHDPSMQVFLFQMQTFPSMGADYAGAYAEIFPRVAEATGATLLPFPLEGVAAVPELNQADGIHPDEAGTRQMADNAWKALEPHLSP